MMLRGINVHFEVPRGEGEAVQDFMATMAIIGLSHADFCPDPSDKYRKLDKYLLLGKLMVIWMWRRLRSHSCHRQITSWAD